MALRAAAMRLRAGALTRRLQQSRAFSTDGRVLSEEERAAENMYIKKMEKEKLEKAKQKLPHEESAAQGSTSESSSSSSIPGPSTDSSKNLAVFAGVAGILAAGWWFVRSSSKDEQKN